MAGAERLPGRAKPGRRLKAAKRPAPLIAPLAVPPAHPPPALARALLQSAPAQAPAFTLVPVPAERCLANNYGSLGFVNIRRLKILGLLK